MKKSKNNRDKLNLARRVAWLKKSDPVPDGVPIPESGKLSPKHARGWALKLLRAHSLRNISAAVPALTSQDMYRLRDISPLSHWAYKFDVDVHDKLAMVADEESAADEWDVAESNDAISEERPWGRTSYDKQKRTWHIVISREAKQERDGIRHAFWHEFGHTLPAQVVSEIIGLRKGESEGDYHNRFAGVMAGTNPADFAVKSTGGRGNWGHAGRPGLVGGSGPQHRQYDGERLPLDDMDVPGAYVMGDTIAMLVEWGETGGNRRYVQTMLDLAEETGDASLGDRARDLQDGDHP